jgi:beta-N-acetylhexosaminidase
LGRADDPSLTYETARAIGRELRAAGFNWNLAPVLDVHTNPTNPIIGDRAFSSDPQRVARLGLLAMRGLADAGLVTTGKHFPGHGETSTDSHRTLPESPQTTDRWRTVEFVPFRAAIRAGIPSVLVAHLDCPALDPAAPSSLSRVIVTDILRGELGFDGVVVSDDLEMGAVTERHEIGEATVRFIEAGGDLALICRSLAPQREAVAALQSAVRRGRLSRHRIQAFPLSQPHHPGDARHQRRDRACYRKRTGARDARRPDSDGRGDTRRPIRRCHPAVQARVTLPSVPLGGERFG